MYLISGLRSRLLSALAAVRGEIAQQLLQLRGTSLSSIDHSSIIIFANFKRYVGQFFFREQRNTEDHVAQMAASQLRIMLQNQAFVEQKIA